MLLYLWISISFPPAAYDDDEVTQNSIVILLGSMAVNEDMCISIESGNVLPSIVRIFKRSTSLLVAQSQDKSSSTSYPCGGKDQQSCAASPNKVRLI